jgi:hypothetical protein
VSGAVSCRAGRFFAWERLGRRIELDAPLSGARPPLRPDVPAPLLPARPAFTPCSLSPDASAIGSHPGMVVGAITLGSCHNLPVSDGVVITSQSRT